MSWNPFKKDSWRWAKVTIALVSGAVGSDAKPHHIKTATKAYYDKWYNDQGKIPNKLDKKK